MLRKGMFIGDRYEILEQVGSGGMSNVYKAKCHKLNRYVAIKVLKPEFSEDRNFVAKFRTEAQSAACLQHPNIVSVYDVGEENGLYYIVMELVEGMTLKKYIRRKGRLSVKEATSIAIQVAQGIECAHNNHIIHRDIKPQNIIISKEGKVKVADFGIARAASANTVNSNAMGSVHYISPEQARGGYIDEKSDIYSLGITLFEMITGHVPFEGDSTVTIALQHIQNQMPDISQYVPDVPISTQQIISKCTQKKADKRYLKISSLIADLKHSLVSPDEDFVQIATDIPVDGKTVMFNPEDIKSNMVQVDIPDDEEPRVEPVAEKKSDVPYEDTAYTEDDDMDDDIDRLNPKLDKILHIGVIAAGAIFIIIIIMVGIKFFGSGSLGKYNSTETESTDLAEGYLYMPNLLGMTEEQVAEVLSENHLGKHFVYKENDEYEEGQVCDQSVKENQIVAENTTITVTISTGSKTMELTDYTGRQYEEAKEALEKLGLKVEREYEFSNEYEINEIMQMYPASGTLVKKGDTITLVVSRGPDDSIAEVPALTGKKLEEAKQLLSQANLQVGEITYQESDKKDEPEGTVIKQSYDADTKLPSDTKVNLVVSSGPGEVTVPSLYGDTKTEASRNLENMKLKLGEVTEEYSDYKKGTVIRQTPAAGSIVATDTKIDVVISKGNEPEESSTARTYEATFSISKSDLTDNGNINEGTVVIMVGNKRIPLSGGYEDISTWPDDVFYYTEKRESGGTVTVTAYVSGADTQVSFPLVLK